jgi:hypothetical protein
MGLVMKCFECDRLVLEQWRRELEFDSILDALENAVFLAPRGDYSELRDRATQACQLMEAACTELAKHRQVHASFARK